MKGWLTGGENQLINQSVRQWHRQEEIMEATSSTTNSILLQVSSQTVPSQPEPRSLGHNGQKGRDVVYQSNGTIDEERNSPEAVIAIRGVSGGAGCRECGLI